MLGLAPADARLPFACSRRGGRAPAAEDGGPAQRTPRLCRRTGRARARFALYLVYCSCKFLPTRLLCSHRQRTGHWPKPFFAPPTARHTLQGVEQSDQILGTRLTRNPHRLERHVMESQGHRGYPAHTSAQESGWVRIQRRTSEGFKNGRDRVVQKQ